ncbi:VWA domain-containing protein [Paludisphaera mucosa]|uniref:VWA domain-containing protein n=1 Tax=Paludisphaera mucosa TaxID=3030827 RepID=A0ABT6FGN1_9BACT|nr:VWA domain-containing protein [Paludisphaera mucosa]MDG3006568.1 VWA domain-containing protein [Paludisphaera mucosa]
MSFDIDDPRLTAFALGELAEADAPEIERLLADHPEALRQVEEIRLTARWLSERLHDEQARESAALAAAPPAPLPAPVPAPRLTTAAAPSPSRRPWWRTPGSLGPLARIAAFFMVGSLLGVTYYRSGDPPHRARSVELAIEDFDATPPSVALDDSAAFSVATPETPAAPAGPAPGSMAGYGGMSGMMGRATAPGQSSGGMGGAMGGMMGDMMGGRKSGEVTARSRIAASRPTVGTPLSAAPAPRAKAVDHMFAKQLQAGAPIKKEEGLAYGYDAAPYRFQADAQRLGNQASSRGEPAASPAKPGSQSGKLESAARSPELATNYNQLTQNAPKDQMADGKPGAPPSVLKEGAAQAAGRGGALALGLETGQAAQALSQEARGMAVALRDGSKKVERGLLRDAPLNRSMQPQDAKYGELDKNDAAKDYARTDPLATADAPAPAPASAAAPLPALEAKVAQEALVHEKEAEQPPPPTAEPVAVVAAPENPFVLVGQEAVSTFSIDVDTASYSIVRRSLMQQNQAPPPDAVRIEEMINYFPYQDAPPAASSPDPFAIHVETARCPWKAENRLARIGIMGRPIVQAARKPSNIVLLADVSGSMDQPNKLPLVQWGFQKLVEQLGENDRVSIVVYAGASGLVLPSTSCLKKAEILSRIEELKAGGSTNGGEGIQLAYAQATANFINDGINRVILATDGDFNVGVTNQDELVKLIESKAKGPKPVFLTVLGFGMDNLKDGTLEKLADKGNGHYAYVDGPDEAYKVLVEEMGATLDVIAKDVKIQVEFKPEKVKAYRLIGYENRVMANEDFANDQKDAGEIGAGHHVTALYEIVPAAQAAPPAANAPTPDSFVVRLRYKKPQEDVSALIERPVADRGLDYSEASDDFKLASSVAGFGMLLRHSPSVGTLTYDGVLELASPTLAHDPSGYRKEFVGMVQKARDLQTPAPAAPAAP